MSLANGVNGVNKTHSNHYGSNKLLERAQDQDTAAREDVLEDELPPRPPRPAALAAANDPTLDQAKQQEVESQFGWGEEAAIVSYALDLPERFAPMIPFFRPEYFVRMETRYVMAWLLNLTEKYGAIPTREILKDFLIRQLCTDDPYADILKVVDRPSNPRETGMIADRLRAWVKVRAYGLLYSEEAITAYSKGELDRLEEIFNQAQEAGNGAAEDADPWTKPIRGDELLADVDEVKPDWLIEDCLAANALAIIGGPEKSMKSALSVALTVALLTGTRFLGRYSVPAKKRVLICSGETTRAEMQMRLRRVLDAMDSDYSEDAKGLVWVPAVPQMSVKSEMARVRSVLRAHRPDVLIIDPLNHGMLAGNNKVSSADLYGTGPILSTFDNLCRSEGATLILNHHFNRKGQPYALPTLRDLTGAGPAQCMRQWLLLNHKQAYEHNGVHHLHLVLGGYGRSSAMALTLDEGKDGRAWRVHLVEAREEAIRERSLQRDNRRAQLVTQLAAALDAIREQEPDGHATKSKIRTETGWNDKAATEAINLAIESGDVEAYEASVRNNLTTAYRRLR